MELMQCQIKNVDDKSTATVFGYIHDLERVLSLPIPEAIINIMLLFYFQFIEQFKETSNDQDIEISKDKKIAIKRTKHSNWRSLFGSIVIDCTLHSDSICQWTLKLHTKYLDREYFSFGIMDNEFINKDTLSFNQYCFNRGEYHNYGLSVNTENTYSGLEFSKVLAKTSLSIEDEFSIPQVLSNMADNVLKLVFNIKARTIEFIGNGKSWGMSFENIDVTRKYRLGICLYNPTSKIEIVDFSMDMIR